MQSDILNHEEHEHREIALCPRAFHVLQRQLVLRQRMAARGLIDHDFVFVQEDGAPPIRACATAPTNTLEAPATATRVPLEGGWGRLSWRKARHFRDLTGGADGSHRASYNSMKSKSKIKPRAASRLFDARCGAP